MPTTALSWPVESVCLRLTTPNPTVIAEQVYGLACRTDFSRPGFCVVTLEQRISSVSFRRLMTDLKGALDLIHQSSTSNRLTYLSASRFNQNRTTRPHLDGGPDESMLMLGYEPSTVKSEIEISDYSKCAYDLGMTPKQFMFRYNPMFHEGLEMLQPYTIRIPCFPSPDYQLLCINNSSAAYATDRSAWQGVLHTATVQATARSAQRVIDSTMIASVPEGSCDLVSRSELKEFIETPDVGCWD
jgi:hypothetical protein